MLLRLDCRLGIRDEHLAKVRHTVGWGYKWGFRLIMAIFAKGEGEHIGGLILSPVATIELAYRFIAGDHKSQLYRRIHSFDGKCLFHHFSEPSLSEAFLKGLIDLDIKLATGHKDTPLPLGILAQRGQFFNIYMLPLTSAWRGVIIALGR